MKLIFHKYHGTGNDFIIIDLRDIEIDISLDELAKKICQRKFGIGSDGFIAIKNSEEADFEVDFYNPDGSKSLCGNGSRCALHFAYNLGLFKDQCSFLAFDGIHIGEYLNSENISIKMEDVKDVKIIDDKTAELNTGSPHYISILENNLDTLDLVKEGKKIRFSTDYSKLGINVNFIEVQDKNRFRMRTYERGVEAETYSCGTGTVASAIALRCLKISNKNDFLIEAKGGLLKVKFDTKNGGFENIFLTGPSKFVFEGTIKI